MRELNWAATPLGPPAAWPQSLRSTVSMLLPSKAQIALFWGPEFVTVYNDAYRPVLGAKHPAALGRPGRETWQEIWNNQLRALFEGVVQSGEAFWARDLLFVIERHGFVEDTYFDVSYDPVRDESGAVGGVFCIVTETTDRVVGERRLAFLRDLAARNATARTERDACVLAMETLAAKPDITFAFAYVGDELLASTPDAGQRSPRPDLDREKVVQAVTDAATGLTGAEFGAFFYNVIDDRGEAYTLYTISGVPREMFSKFPMPRNTEVFEPTFKGTSVMRSDDITADPRYGHNAPYHGMPPGHLPVRSYLAVPVKGRGGDVIGGLFFGHSGTGRFDGHHERIAVGIAAWASVALENAQLYMSVQEASRLKDEFLASLSHELRTPLNAILGYARMLQSGIIAPEKRAKAIDTIERNATSLTQIVEDVLDISRIVSGKIRLNVQRSTSRRSSAPPSTRSRRPPMRKACASKR